MRKAVNDLNEFGGSDARLAPRVAIKFFLNAISDKDLSTAITVICNDVTVVTTLDNAIRSVQAQNIGVLATVTRRISSLKGGGGGGGGGSGNAGRNKNLKKRVKALVAKSSNFVPYIKANTAAW
jgi:hypothetical protein